METISLVIDAIMYCYEPDALAVRMEELKDVVDYHVVVEGTETFKGEARSLSNPQHPKIMNVAVTFPENMTAWDRERYQRAYSAQFVRDNFHADDLVIVADTDEIPHPESIRNYNGPATLNIDYREWFMDWRAPDNWQPHHKPFIMPAGHIVNASRIRWDDPPPIDTRWRGWHLSSLGDGKMASEKLQSFSHQEYNEEQWTNIDKLTNRISKHQDLLERFYLEYTTDLPSCASKFPELLGGKID